MALSITPATLAIPAEVLATAEAFQVGSGAPEGVVTADPGTRYLDLLSTLGARVWRKATGTGDTGWVVAEGDTGWRTVASWTAGVQDGANQIGTINTTGLTLNGTGRLILRRINDGVYLGMPNSNANAMQATTTVATNMFTANIWPVGFRPESNQRAMVLPVVSGGYSMLDFAATVSQPRIVAATGTLLLNNASADWLTAESWPASLPGVSYP